MFMLDTCVRSLFDVLARVVTTSSSCVNPRSGPTYASGYHVHTPIIAIDHHGPVNIPRLVLACGGNAVNSVDDLEESDLGYAGIVYEHAIEDDKFTFVEQTKNPTSCSVLVTGPNEHTLYQMKDALRDGLRSVGVSKGGKNVGPPTGRVGVTVLVEVYGGGTWRAKLFIGIGGWVSSVWATLNGLLVFFLLKK